MHNFQIFPSHSGSCVTVAQRKLQHVMLGVCPSSITKLKDNFQEILNTVKKIRNPMNRTPKEKHFLTLLESVAKRM